MSLNDLHDLSPADDEPIEGQQLMTWSWTCWPI